MDKLNLKIHKEKAAQHEKQKSSANQSQSNPTSPHGEVATKKDDKPAHGTGKKDLSVADIGGAAREKDKHFYADRAIIRYRQEPESKEVKVSVLSDSVFFNLIDNKRSNDWKTVEVIQTCIKSKYGIGEPILITFYAPID